MGQAVADMLRWANCPRHLRVGGEASAIEIVIRRPIRAAGSLPITSGHRMAIIGKSSGLSWLRRNEPSAGAVRFAPEGATWRDMFQNMYCNVST